MMYMMVVMTVDWVRQLPDKDEMNRKIAMIKKFGSPNVFTEFQPQYGR